MAVQLQTTEWRKQRIDAIRERHKLGSDVRIGLRGFTPAIKLVDPNARKFTARITSDALDRDKEVMLPQGMDPTEFLKTGTIFWNHDYDRPIGDASNLTKDDRSWASDGQIMSRPADFKGDFFPDFVWAFITQVRNPGISVGFEVGDGRAPVDKDKELYGPTLDWVHTQWKLLEFSVAPLQANIEAVVEAVGKGAVKPETAELWVPGIELPKQGRKTVFVVLAKSPLKKRPKPKPKPILVDVVKTEVSRAVRRRLGKLYE